MGEGEGVGEGDGIGEGEGDGKDDGEGDGQGEGEGEGDGEGEGEGIGEQVLHLLFGFILQQDGKGQLKLVFRMSIIRDKLAMYRWLGWVYINGKKKTKKKDHKKNLEHHHQIQNFDLNT